MPARTGQPARRSGKRGKGCCPGLNNADGNPERGIRTVPSSRDIPKIYSASASFACQTVSCSFTRAGPPLPKLISAAAAFFAPRIW